MVTLSVVRSHWLYVYLWNSLLRTAAPCGCITGVSRLCGTTHNGIIVLPSVYAIIVYSFRRWSYGKRLPCSIHIFFLLISRRICASSFVKRVICPSSFVWDSNFDEDSSDSYSKIRKKFGEHFFFFKTFCLSFLWTFLTGKMKLLGLLKRKHRISMKYAIF